IGFYKKCFLWGVVLPLRLAMGFATGSTFQALEVVFLLTIVYWTTTRRFPLEVLIISLCLLVMLIPIRGEFRAITWYGEGADLSTYDKFVLYVQTVAKMVRGQGMTWDEAVSNTAWRISHILTFGDVINLTPDFIPYMYGETYYPILTKPIPRILYPDKPIEDMGQLFGHRYRFLDANDFHTSFNLPQLVELYINFGPWGVAFGMFLIGLLFRCIQQLVGCSRNIGNIVLGSYTFMHLSFMENSFSMTLGVVFWFGVFFVALHCFIKTTESMGGAKSIPSKLA